MDLLEAFSRYRPRALMVDPDAGDYHPSQLGHRVAADAIYRWISAHAKAIGLPPLAVRERK